MNPEQCRMARAALNWSAVNLASAAGVGYSTVARYETGSTIQPAKVQAMRRALEAAGVLFVDSGKHSGAVVPPQGA
jgi:transcriptional regulator with XRE-family HTH domain